MNDLNIAEITYENGTVQYRYARRLSEDGSQWIRHGLFQAYYPSGTLASEGSYTDGIEHGLWTDFHQNGIIAARGDYHHGNEMGVWEYWDEDGTPTKTPS
jgi:antitoxin component YwqK of YwqJK toxin-antitoxin module